MKFGFTTFILRELVMSGCMIAGIKLVFLLDGGQDENFSGAIKFVELESIGAGLMTSGDPRNDEIVLMFVWDLEHGDKVH